jgi:photosystem II stability/assembly factor-like uncharacterized protein
MRRLAAAGLALLVLPLSAQAPAPAPTPTPAPRNILTSQILFAGTRSGLWRTRNWGNVWERVKSEALASLGECTSIAPLAPFVYVAGEGGLYFSEDFGETWKQIYATGPILALQVSRYPQADPTVFIGTPKGLLKSTDAGHTFHETPLMGTPVLRIEWPGPDLIVTTATGIAISSDAAGVFWRPESGLPADEVHAIAVSSFYIVDPVLYVGAGENGVFRSADGGHKWASAGLDGRSVTDLYWLGPMLYAVTDKGLKRTLDNGRSWVPLGEVPGRPQLGRMLFPLMPTSGAEAFVATSRGVFWTGDAGEHWQASGLKDEIVLTLATFPPPDPMQTKK